MKQSFYHINGVLWVIKMLLCFLNMPVGIGDGNIVPAVDIDFLNFITSEIFRQHRILRHFAVESVR